MKKQEREAKLAAEKEVAATVEVKLENLTLDASLPEPKSVKIRDAPLSDGKRVRVCGFVHRLRQQSESF